MIMRPSGSTPWLVLGAGVAALLGIVLLATGGKEVRPKPLMVAGPHSPPAPPASPELKSGIQVVPAGTIVLVDSSNTPPSLLASVVLTGTFDPSADRVQIDIPVPSPQPDVPAAPESRRSEAAPEAPPDSMATDSPSPGGASAEALVAEASAAGGGDSMLIPPVVQKAAWLEYPREARKRKSEGNVEVRILVDLAGGVSAVELERGTSDESLNQAALAAARSMRFRAARQGGRPVAVWFNYQFSFRLPS